MQNTPHYLSATPSTPYGRESVLSTRSLSYLSNDATSFPALSAQYASQSRSTSYASARRTRRSTLTSESEYGLEMAETREQELQGIPELPESVAHSPLFLLPREIRDRIYSFCLTSQNNREVQFPSAFQSYALQPQLLRTCKIVYSEAGPLLYVVNAMTFHHPSDANMFVRAMASPVLSQYITTLNCHIKFHDYRVWFPYITSSDPSRNLKDDFSNLRELNVRYRSNKWSPSIPPETNLKHWSDDSRLDELIASLRSIFLPHLPQGPKNESEFETWLSNHSGSFPLHPGDPSFQKQWLEIHKARLAYAAKNSSTPTIRVVVACRVHATHFNALTSAPTHPVRDLTRSHNGTGIIQQRSDDLFAPPTPVKEGEPFRGFTPIDLRGGMKRLTDHELGSANIAQTPYADKDGILLSLEIHSVDPKREAAGPA